MSETVVRILSIVLLSLLTVVRAVYGVRFGRLFDFRSFRNEPVGVLASRFIPGTVMFVFLFFYLFRRDREPAWAVVDLPDILRILGVLLSLASLVLLALSHAALDGFFSSTVVLRKDHRLVREGPYAVIRHPMYMAFLGFFVGLLLLSGRWVFAGSGILVILSLMFLRRPLEELALLKRFGDEYLAYARSVPAFLPCLGRRR